MKVRPILPLVVVVGLLASALTPPAARARQRDPGVGRTAPSAGDLYYALVIGNDEYASLPKLTTVARDARAVERVLRESYGFQTKLLVNVTRSEVVAALSEYRRKLSADASLLVYYAGHGHRDAAADKAYWLPVDATREDVSNRMSADEMTTAVRAVPARHVLVVSDSCYSGALTIGVGASPARPSEREQFLQKMAAGRSRTLLASGGDEPLANDGDSGHSVFAAALLRGLRRMDGPRFTASELFVGYVLGPVASRTGRMPVYNPLRNSGHESGDFVFARIKPPDPDRGPCDDLEAKANFYRPFLDNFKGNAEQQKVAYEAGKEYISRYDRCPGESDKKVVGYIRNWVAKYEAAVREWERWQGRRP
ncbi:MAG TPA: caspase family protein [Pyrinomonadaceae bacterium]|jgi:uncharacterized caspase-like protein